MRRLRFARLGSKYKHDLMARLANLPCSEDAFRTFAIASSIVFSMLVFAMTARAAPGAGDDILDYARPLILLSRPLPLGVTFSNFTGEVFEDSQADEPANQQVGAGWLRVASAGWPYVSPSSGVYDWGGIPGLGYNPDQEILTAHSHGQEVLVDLAYTANWAFSAACQALNGNGNPICQHYAPENLSDWNAYVTAAVTHYSAPPFNIKYFQIWNEPQYCNIGFWCITDGGTAYKEFVDQIYNPAATVIHSYGGQVAFAGWNCDIGNSNWTQCEGDFVKLLNYNNARANSEYIDLHYAPLSVWEDLAGSWIGFGRVKGVWQSEIQGTFLDKSGQPAPQPGALPPTYLNALYWALSSGGNWSSNNPDRYKFFYFAGNYCPPVPPSQQQTLVPETALTIVLASYEANCAPIVTGNLLTLTQNGTYHAVLASVLNGGNLGTFSNYSSNLPKYPATNGSVGFLVGQNQIVIAFFPTIANFTMNVNVTLSAPTRSVAFIDALGNSVLNGYSQGGGVLAVSGNSGSSLSPAYLLTIQF
jgi:hypothetical protein